MLGTLFDFIDPVYIEAGLFLNNLKISKITVTTLDLMERNYYNQ